MFFLQRRPPVSCRPILPWTIPGAPPQTSPPPRHRYAPTLVVAASIIAAVRLAREEDISGRSPRLLAAVANSVQLAKNILDTVRKRFPGEE